MKYKKFLHENVKCESEQNRSRNDDMKIEI